MKTEILIAIITGSMSLLGVVVTSWLTFKTKKYDINTKHEGQVQKQKKSRNIIWFFIFVVILIASWGYSFFNFKALNMIYITVIIAGLISFIGIIVTTYLNFRAGKDKTTLINPIKDNTENTDERDIFKYSKKLIA